MGMGADESYLLADDPLVIYQSETEWLAVNVATAFSISSRKCIIFRANRVDFGVRAGDEIADTA